MCWLYHKWTRWSAPLLMEDLFGCKVLAQKRECTRCGKVKVQEIDL